MKEYLKTILRQVMLLTLMVMPAISMAQTTPPEEKHKLAWVGTHDWIGKTYIEGEGYVPYWYYMNGDTVISDKTYYKIYGMNRRIYGDSEDHYYASYRVDGCKVFCIYDGETEEYMWADFDMVTGDTWTTPDLKDTPELCIKVLHHGGLAKDKHNPYFPRYLIVALYNRQTDEVVSSAKCLIEYLGDIHNFATKNSWNEEENNEFMLLVNAQAVYCWYNDIIERFLKEAAEQGFHLKQPREHTR